MSIEILKYFGYPLDNARKKLREIEALSAHDHQKFVDSKKSEIVNFHLKENKYYKEIASDFMTWEKLPVINKRFFQQKMEYLNTYKPKEVYIGKTSGSSGHPFYFAKDKFCHALTWANIESNFSMHNLFNKKQARFYGMPKELKGKIILQLKNIFFKRKSFNVFDLSDDAMKSWLKKFTKNQFVFLNGYTSVLVYFAKYLKSQNITLTSVCPTLKACVVTSEMLSMEERYLMEKQYGVKVINEYGASELDLIAFEDLNNEWRINTNTLFVEILDENNNHVPDGETGRIVITSLFNKAFPFIRYDIGDIGRIERINSKFVKLINLQGRSEDLVRLPSGNTLPGLVFYYITKSLMEDNNEIYEIKVYQMSINSFRIEYVSSRELSEIDIIEIERHLLNYLESNLEIEFVKKNNLNRMSSGKLRQFTSLLK